MMGAWLLRWPYQPPEAALSGQKHKRTTNHKRSVTEPDRVYEMRAGWLVCHERVYQKPWSVSGVLRDNITKC